MAVKSTAPLGRPYRCPGCDREAFVYVQRTTLHSFGNNGLVYSISCRQNDETAVIPNSCLGEWFAYRSFTTETSAVSEWNTAIIEMAAAALGISRTDALALKEGRRSLTPEQSS